MLLLHRKRCTLVQPQLCFATTTHTPFLCLFSFTYFCRLVQHFCSTTHRCIRVNNRIVHVPYSLLVVDVLFQEINHILPGICQDIEARTHELRLFWIGKNRTEIGNDAQPYQLRHTSQMLTSIQESVGSRTIIHHDEPFQNGHFFHFNWES